MNQASIIRDKVLKHGLGRTASDELISRLGDEIVNRRVLVPFCIIDIAYKKWQENFKDMPVKQEMKILKKRVQNLFEKGIFSPKGSLYGALDEDEICFLCDYSDKIYEQIQTDLQVHYYTLQNKMMDIDLEQREIICKIFEMQTILLVSQSSLWVDWKIKYPILDNAISAIELLEKRYRQYALGNKNKEIKYSKDDTHLCNSLTIINKKIYEVAID